METTHVPTGYGHGGYKTVIVSSLLILMLGLMVGGRLLSRVLQKARLQTDDYVLILATVTSLALCGIAIAEPKIAGLGGITESTPDPATTGKIFITWLVIYSVAVALSKWAILLLYLRVFTTRNSYFTVACYFSGSIVTATCISYIFGAVFQCQPVHYLWNKSIQGGSCIDIITFERYQAIPNVVTGVMMLIIPLPMVWRLNVALAAKLALTATFLHGIIGLVASTARLVILFGPDPSSRSNAVDVAWTIWTTNEPANYVIAACLPTLRPIFIRILPASFFVLSKKRSSNRPSGSSGKKSNEKANGGPKCRVYITNPHLSGPWGTQGYDEGLTKQEEDREFDQSSSLNTSTAQGFDDLEKSQILVTKTVRVGTPSDL